jgi:hypothetical protein
MFSRRGLIAATLAVAAPGVAAAQDAAPIPTSPVQPPPPKDDGIIRVPIQVTRNSLWTWVWLDGQGPFRFTLDSGDAVGYSINLGLATKLNLPHSFSVGVGGVTGDARSEAFTVKDVIIGGVLRDGERVFVPKRRGGFTVGLLPGRLLQLLPCDLDFASGELRLYQRGRPPRDGFARIPLAVHDITIPFVIDVTLDGERYRLGVDTGDEGAVTLFASTVRGRGLWDRYPKHLETGLLGVVKASKLRLVRLRTLQIAAFEMPDPVVGLIDPTEPGEHAGMDGLIGMETLRRFALSFDAGDNALWLKPNGALRQPFRYDRSGLVFRVEDDRRTVIAAAPGSPAEKAGIAPGDVIRKAGPDFAWRLQDGPGTVVEFDVERAGQDRPVRLVLADLI